MLCPSTLQLLAAPKKFPSSIWCCKINMIKLGTALDSETMNERNFFDHVFIYRSSHGRDELCKNNILRKLEIPLVFHSLSWPSEDAFITLVSFHDTLCAKAQEQTIINASIVPIRSTHVYIHWIIMESLIREGLLPTSLNWPPTTIIQDEPACNSYTTSIFFWFWTILFQN